MKIGDKVSPRYNNDIGTVTAIGVDGDPGAVVVEYPWGPRTHAGVALIVLGEAGK